MLSEEDRNKHEYWTEFQAYAMKDVYFSGELGYTGKPPTHMWQKTLRTSDVHLRVYQKRRANK
ncbi:MAG: hypothetical protein IJ520_06515, partial [Synergistaceae bacterium]|nr:hypothetical protein [Synergistaceae bacterium]